MNEQTLEALNKSIRHWQAYADGKWEEEGVPGVHNCALCQLFHPEYNHSGVLCNGCPVRLKTRLGVCCDTPWKKVCLAINGHGIDSPQFIEAAKEELEFLKSLLP